MPAYSFFGHGMSVCGTCTSLKKFSPEESEYTRTLSPRRARLSARLKVWTTPPLGLVEYVRSATSSDFIKRLRFEPRYEVPHPVKYPDSHVGPCSRPHLDERLRGGGLIFSVKGFSREAETHQQACQEIVARGRESRPESEYRARFFGHGGEIT